MQLAFQRPGGLGGEHACAAAAPCDGGDERDGGEHDAQASDPLGERAPEKDGVRQRLHIVDDGGAGRGEARHRLEVGVSEVVDVTAQHKRQRAEERKHHPDERDQQIGVAPRQSVVGIAAKVFEHEAEERRHDYRPHEWQRILLFIAQRHRHAEAHHEGFLKEQGTDDFVDELEVDHSDSFFSSPLAMPNDFVGLKYFSSNLRLTPWQNITTWSPGMMVVLPDTSIPLPSRTSPPMITS